MRAISLLETPYVQTVKFSTAADYLEASRGIRLILSAPNYTLLGADHPIHGRSLIMTSAGELNLIYTASAIDLEE